MREHFFSKVFFPVGANGDGFGIFLLNLLLAFLLNHFAIGIAFGLADGELVASEEAIGIDMAEIILLKVEVEF